MFTCKTLIKMQTIQYTNKIKVHKIYQIKVHKRHYEAHKVQLLHITISQNIQVRLGIMVNLVQRENSKLKTHSILVW